MISTILLIAAMVLAPLIAGGMGELTDGIVQIFVYLAAAIYIYNAYKSRKAYLAMPAGSMLLIAFLITAALGSIFTECAYNSIVQWMFWFGCLAAYFLSVQIFTDKKKSLVALMILSLTATAICLLAIRNQAIMSGGGADFWSSITSGQEVRLFGTFINPNFFGGFLVITIPITIALFLMSEGLAGIAVYSIAVISQLFALVLTSSKFSIIALIFGLIVFALPSVIRKYLTRQQWIKLGVLLVIAAALLIPASASLRTRVSESAGNGSQVHSTAFRIYTWKATAKMIASKPVTGVGMGNFEIAFPRYAVAALTKHAHQSFLQIGSESGVIVLALFIAGLIAIAAKGMRNAWNASTGSDSELFAGMINTNTFPILGWAILGGLAASCTRNLVDSDWYIMGISLTFWVCAGILAGVFGENNKRHKIKANFQGIYLLLALCIFLSFRFAIGDYYANISSDSDRYSRADSMALINPAYKRQLAMRGSLDRESAVDVAKKAIELAPKDAAGYFTLGILQEPAEAAKSLKKALEYNPHSTQIMRFLASIYGSLGEDNNELEIYQRLIDQEDSPHETVKGVPELVDTNYAYAHVYLAQKLMGKRDYAKSAEHLEKACDRLERWKNAGMFLELARVSGQLTQQDEQEKLNMLKSCYAQLHECYNKLGKQDKAGEALQKLKQIAE